MPVVSEALVSKSEQRAIEKAKKDAAIEKKRVALQAAMDAGLASSTELSSKLIKNEWIKYAANVMAATVSRTLNGSEAGRSSAAVQEFIEYISVEDK